MGQPAVVSVLSVASGEQQHWWLPQGLASPASLLAQVRGCPDGAPAELAASLAEHLRNRAGARRVAIPAWSQVRDRYLVGLHGPPAPRVVICRWHCPVPGAGWIRSGLPQTWPQRPT